MQFFRAVARLKLDAVPHDKIVRTEFLKSLIGSAKFIESAPPKPEEDRSGDWMRPTLRQNNETQTRSDDMLVDVQEK